MGTEYDMNQNAFAVSHEDQGAESPPVWEPQEYKGWAHESTTENLGTYLPDSYAPPPETAHSEHQSNQEPSTAGQDQQWASYYPAPTSQQQEAGISQGQGHFAPPPLPMAPPPQPPPPPDIPSATSWSSSGQTTGGSESKMDPSGYATGSYYSQGQQPVQDGSYAPQDSLTNVPGPTVSGTSTPSANGSHTYGQTYSGYGSTADPYAYGGSGYQNYNYGYLQQGNDSYSQNTGAYQNSGAPYQAAVNSFQNTSSYADTASYQNTSTYYNNAGVYQNTGAYTGYSAVPNTWSDGSFGNYGGYTGYTGYSGQDATANATVSQHQSQYPQDYQAQWAEYYASLQSQNTEPSGPPGTDVAVPNSAVTTPAVPTYASIVAHGASANFSVPTSQPPPPGTQPSWPQSYSEALPAQVSSLQPAQKPVLNSWEAPSVLMADQQGSAPQLQTQQPAPVPQQQQAQTVVQYPVSHPQHSVQYPQQQQQSQQQQQQPTHYQQSVQAVTSQYQQAQLQQQARYKQSQPQNQSHLTVQQERQQASPGFHSQAQDMTSSESGLWRPGKVQVPNNSRITQNVGATMSGTSKVLSADVSKPAYISIGKPSRMSSDDVADATLQPGMFPPSLRAYVERALSRCRDDAQKAACQEIMKEMITEASRDGSLFTKDWDTEPLFSLPEVVAGGKGSIQRSSATPVIMKLERSPNRRVRSRWEPVAEEVEDEDKYGRLQGRDGKKEGIRDRANDRENSISPSKREMSWIKAKPSQQQTPGQLGKQRPQKGVKRVRRTVALNYNGGTNSESESEEEEDTGGIHLGSAVSAETPEEKKRRQSRTKRFDRSKELSVGAKGSVKAKGVSGGSATARRATALQLAMSAGDGNGRAVEDIDWDALTVKGTCQEIEKRFLRLTSAPDPSTVRPEDVLRKALAMVQSTSKSYLYKCEQLKSIRQDLTVQRIRDELTVEVYETHGRMALEAGDLPEYNQCLSRLKELYGEGIKGCSNEFAAYSLLYIIFQRGNSRELLSSMARLSLDAKKDEAVQHALAVREAVAIGNYHAFFRLYRTAPNLNPCLMDLHVEKMRFEALNCMSRAYRPSVSVLFIARALGFSTSTEGEEREVEGMEECEEWLRAHGAQLIVESPSGELVMDAKASSTSLFMPEPEDVVPHGDANLALNDFFART